jgi:IS30 family transposase
MISLTLADRRRRKIARWRMAGVDIEIIGGKPGRHRSTIFREFKRNTFVDKLIPDLNGCYCVTAHEWLENGGLNSGSWYVSRR